MSDDFDDISDATVHVAIDADKQTTVVHYSRLFNLGNYENEKIGITLSVIPGQAVQDVITAAAAEVKKQHEEYRDIWDKINEARCTLRDLKDTIGHLEEVKAALETEVKGLEESNPEAAERVKEQMGGDDDEEAFIWEEDGPEDEEDEL